MMSRMIMLFTVLLFIASSAAADEVVLYTGEHIEGQILQQTADEITILRSNESGNIRYVQKIKQCTVVYIKESDIPGPSKPNPTTKPQRPIPPQASTSKPNLLSVPSNDQRDLLTTVIEGFKKQDYASVNIKITRLINNASPGQLFYLSAETRKQLKMSLADLAAEIHYQHTLAKSKGRPVRFRYVTSYEKSALVQRITEAYEKALKQEIRPVPPSENREEKMPPQTSPASQPADPGVYADVINYWIDKPLDYDGDEAACEVFANHIRYTTSLLKEKLRLDVDVKKNRMLRDQLLQEKANLYALYKAVEARRKGALTSAEKAAILAERRAFLEQYYRQREQQRMKQEAFSKKVIQQIEDTEKRKKLEEGFRKEMERQRKINEKYFQEFIDQQQENQQQNQVLPKNETEKIPAQENE